MRSLSAKLAYRTSALAARNAALHTAVQLQALRGGDALYDGYVAARRINPERVTTLAGLCAQDEASGTQIDAGREPHLLREDTFSPGDLTTVAIYDTATAGMGRDGRVDVELPRGKARLAGNTLVYWR
ncbi:MAG: hypothetical protein WC617_12655 [Rhodanobacter sp.]|jgi:hypothetical protein